MIFHSHPKDRDQYQFSAEEKQTMISAASRENILFAYVHFNLIITGLTIILDFNITWPCLRLPNAYLHIVLFTTWSITMEPKDSVIMIYIVYSSTLDRVNSAFSTRFNKAYLVNLYKMKLVDLWVR